MLCNKNFIVYHKKSLLTALTLTLCATPALKAAASEKETSKNVHTTPPQQVRSLDPSSQYFDQNKYILKARSPARKKEDLEADEQAYQQTILAMGTLQTQLMGAASILSDRVDTLTTEKESLAKARTELLTQLAELEQKTRSVDSQLQSVVDDKKDVDSRLATLTEEHAALTKEHQTTKTDLLELETKHGDLEKNLEGLRAAHQVLTDQHTAAVEDRKLLDAALAKRDAEELAKAEAEKMATAERRQQREAFLKAQAEQAAAAQAFLAKLSAKS